MRISDWSSDVCSSDLAILNEAIEILKRYPDLSVEVAGHTDSKGTDAYNQALSERRASAVYDYLTSNGIDAGRLVGPVGYGESRPIAPNTNDAGSDNPEGRARNRRTELNVPNTGSTPRTEKRREGKQCVDTFRSRVAPINIKKKN